MLIDQYRPQRPDPRNALHELQVMRMEARRNADKEWHKLKCHVHDTLHPKPVKKQQTLLGSLVANAQTIAKGVVIGARVVAAVKSLRKKK